MDVAFLQCSCSRPVAYCCMVVAGKDLPAARTVESDVSNNICMWVTPTRVHSQAVDATEAMHEPLMFSLPLALGSWISRFGSCTMPRYCHRGVYDI